MSTPKPPAPQDISPTAVLPPGCDGDGNRMPAGVRGPTGCLHHYPPGRNLAAEGCICPAWFDGGGWHLIERNPECGAHAVTAAKEQDR